MQPQTSPAEYERFQSQITEASKTLTTKYGADAKWALVLPVATVFNMCLFISQFSAVSTLSKEGLPSMSTEGLSWFRDLTVSDPYFALPVLCAAATLAMVETGAMGAEMGQAQTAKTMKWVMRGCALLFIPAGGYVPAAVGWLWFSNSLCSLVQAGVLRSAGLRRRLGLPDLASVQKAAAAAAAAGGSPFAKLQEMLDKSSGKGDSGAAAAGVVGAGGSSVGSSGSAAAAAAAAPPPPGTKPSRLVTQKPAGWKVKKR